MRRAGFGQLRLIALVLLSLIGMVPGGEGLKCYACWHEKQSKEFCDKPSKHGKLETTICEPGKHCFFELLPAEHMDEHRPARHCVDQLEAECIMEVFNKPCASKLEQKEFAQDLADCKMGDSLGGGRDAVGLEAMSDDQLGEAFDCYCDTELCNDMEGMDVNGMPVYPVHESHPRARTVNVSRSVPAGQESSWRRGRSWKGELFKLLLVAGFAWAVLV